MSDYRWEPYGSRDAYIQLIRPDDTRVTLIATPEDDDTRDDLRIISVELNKLRANLEQADALADALRNQGLLQNSPNGVIWHVHDCPASFDFAECNYRCRVAREAFALAGTEPYVSQETRRDTEVYE